MPNVAKVLKEEISRLSRKEARSVTASLAKSNATLRSTVAALRKEVSGLKAEQKRLSLALSKLARNMGVEPAKEEFRMTSRGVRALRRKLRLSQVRFAALLAVSPQAVFLWESKGGHLQFREESEAALRAVQNINASEARERLAKKARQTKTGKKGAKGTRRKARK